MNNDTWQRVLNLISLQISISSFEAWFEPTRAEFDEDTIFLYCVNIFQCDWIEANYYELISTSIESVLGKEYKVILTIEK